MSKILSGNFIEVPPPSKLPIYHQSEQLGILSCLRSEKADHQWRCAHCSKMQPYGSWLVWVPDSVMSHDPNWSIEEAARLNTFNGHASGWCIKCAPKNRTAKETNPSFIRKLLLRLKP